MPNIIMSIKKNNYAFKHNYFFFINIIMSIKKNNYAFSHNYFFLLSCLFMMQKSWNTQINDNLKNNKKPINLIGDKGYIKGDDYRNNIYNKNKIKLIIPKKRNMKNNKQAINGIDELLLKY